MLIGSKRIVVLNRSFKLNSIAKNIGHEFKSQGRKNLLSNFNGIGKSISNDFNENEERMLNSLNAGLEKIENKNLKMALKSLKTFEIKMEMKPTSTIVKSLFPGNGNSIQNRKSNENFIFGNNHYSGSLFSPSTTRLESKNQKRQSQGSLIEKRHFGTAWETIATLYLHWISLFDLITNSAPVSALSSVFVKIHTTCKKGMDLC